MRNFKVILGSGGFYAVPLTTAGPEAHASSDERKRLLRSVGLAPDGSLRGLTEDEAKRLAFRLSRARVRTAARGRLRRA